MNETENIKKYLEPCCLILLALNQRHIVEKYLKIISIAQNDEHQYLYTMFFNYIRSPDVDKVNKAYSYLEELENLPYNSKFNTESYREFADWCRSRIG